MLTEWEDEEGDAAPPLKGGFRLVQPGRLRDARIEAALTLACAVAILAVAVAEALMPSLVSLGSLVFLPVLCAAWWLGDVPFVAVTAVAVAVRLVGIISGGVDAGTAAAEATMILAVAAAVRLLRSGTERLRQAEARLGRRAARLRLVGERDRIGDELNRSTVRRLFALTLQLQAVAASTDDPRARARIDAAIDELDELCSEVRAIVFNQPLEDS